jgi:hypothetical protein
VVGSAEPGGKGTLRHGVAANQQRADLDEHAFVIRTTLALLNFVLSIQECAHADANRLKHAVYVPHRR